MERRIYRIPTNYKDSGYIFNGQIAKRNAIDAVVLGLIGFLIARMFPVSGEAALTVYILFIGLLGMIGIVGFKQIPISVYVVDMLHWRKRKKKPYFYNDKGGAYTVSAADLLINEPQLRDMLADAIDSVRNSLASKRPSYIEGETFEFALDPELEALKAAQERMIEKAAEKPANESKEASVTKSASATATESEPMPQTSAGQESVEATIDAEIKAHMPEEQQTSPHRAQNITSSDNDPATKIELPVVPMGSVDINSLLNNIRLNDIEEGVIEYG